MKAHERRSGVIYAHELKGRGGEQDNFKKMGGVKRKNKKQTKQNYSAE